MGFFSISEAKRMVIRRKKIIEIMRVTPGFHPNDEKEVSALSAKEVNELWDGIQALEKANKPATVAGAKSFIGKFTGVAVGGSGYCKAPTVRAGFGSVKPSNNNRFAIHQFQEAILSIRTLTLKERLVIAGWNPWLMTPNEVLDATRDAKEFLQSANLNHSPVLKSIKQTFFN